MGNNGPNPSVVSDALADFLHDLKQPLNLIKVIAQDVRLDVKKNRLSLETLPDSMTEIESSIDTLVSQIDEYRQQVKERK